MKKTYIVYFDGLSKLSDMNSEPERLNKKVSELLNDGYLIEIYTEKYILFVKSEMERYSD